MTQLANVHAAIVLAAGGSLRLGRPKQLLVRDGETMVHRALRLAMETLPVRLVVVLGAHEAAIRASCADFHAEYLRNREWRSGLASSLRCAATALADHAGPVLVLGCDQPALELAHLLRLIDAAAIAESRCAATWQDGVPGSPAVITSTLLQRAGELSGNLGFGRQLRALPASELARLEAPELQLDVDSEDDVREAISRGWLDASNLAMP
jgi:molybdenum cofactor cytidylyltransferase